MNAMQAQPHITEDTLFFWTGTDNLRRGPVALSTLRNLMRNGTVPKAAQLWCDGWPDWQPLAHVAQQLALPMHTAAAVPADILPAKPARSWLKIATWSAAWIALLLGIGLLVIKNLPEDMKRDHRARMLAEDFVISKLATPRTADFENVEVKAMSDGTRVVSGSVHHQNTYGALVRSRFFVRISGDEVLSVEMH